MAGKQVYSVCGLCTVRCPIQVEVHSNRVRSIQGNPHAAGVEGALCARGGAGIALVEDAERPQYPLIRTGARGEGKWRQATWGEALNYTADRLKEAISRYGAKTVWPGGWQCGTRLAAPWLCRSILSRSVRFRRSNLQNLRKNAPIIDVPFGMIE